MWWNLTEFIKVSLKNTVLISCCLHVSNFSRFSKCLNTWSEAVVYLLTLFGKTKLNQPGCFSLAWVHDHRVSSLNQVDIAVLCLECYKFTNCHWKPLSSEKNGSKGASIFTFMKISATGDQQYFYWFAPQILVEWLLRTKSKIGKWAQDGYIQGGTKVGLQLFVW